MKMGEKVQFLLVRDSWSNYLNLWEWVNFFVDFLTTIPHAPF